MLKSQESCSVSGVGLAHPAVLRPRSAAVSFLFQPTFRRGLALGCLQDLGTSGAEFKKDSQFRIGTFPQCKAVDGCSSTKERKVVGPALRCGLLECLLRPHPGSLP